MSFFLLASETSGSMNFGQLLRFLSGIMDYFSSFMSTMPGIFVGIFVVYITLSVIYMIVGRQA